MCPEILLKMEMKALTILVGLDSQMEHLLGSNHLGLHGLPLPEVHKDRMGHQGVVTLVKEDRQAEEVKWVEGIPVEVDKDREEHQGVVTLVKEDRQAKEVKWVEVDIVALQEAWRFPEANIQTEEHRVVHLEDKLLALWEEGIQMEDSKVAAYQKEDTIVDLTLVLNPPGTKHLTHTDILEALVALVAFQAIQTMQRLHPLWEVRAHQI